MIKIKAVGIGFPVPGISMECTNIAHSSVWLWASLPATVAFILSVFRTSARSARTNRMVTPFIVTSLANSQVLIRVEGGDQRYSRDRIMFGSIYSAKQVFKLATKGVRTATTLVVMCMMRKMKAEIPKEEATS